MACPACGGETHDAAKFCAACGRPLTVPTTCPACGTPHSPGQRFCEECGQPLLARADTRAPGSYTPKHLAEKILTSRGALEGERKQVTVLFADVKGSMELAERVNPEEWHQILDRFFAILAEGVHRFEGTVNQYTGDGIMALFGAPIAHEDHAQRACWAALHLRDALRGYADELRLSRGLNFSVRMGLNSGEVVVGRIGDDLRMDYTAQGHTVGLAHRMEQLAEAGRIYVSEHTARLVIGYFHLRDLGLLTVKGVTEPVRVRELEGAGALRTRLEASRTRGFSRFVGRADEMATIEAALERAVGGQGQVVGIVAEAGTGKSRLCFEFAERCRARGISVYEAHAFAHGKALPLLPILELWRRYFGITEQDGAQTARDKIAGRMVLLDPKLAAALPLMFDFLGVPDPERPAPLMEPEARQRQVADLTRRLARLRSQREPAVLVIEDLHWLDAASEQFLENLVEAVPGGRTLLLVNFRPEYHAAWMQKSWYQQLPLLPLGEEATAELLRDLLGADPALAPLAALVRERTAGNPFFIEEVVQSLVDRGLLVRGAPSPVLTRPVTEIQIPATVQAVLAARIDRLGEREKRVLQTAAVVGKTFTEPILERVLGADGGGALPADELAGALRALTQAEFLYEQALYPVAEHAFKHPLTQEVAYGAQLGVRRTRVHAAVARTLEDLGAERLGERAVLLAYHWDAAGDAAQAARWHRRAAEWAGSNDTAAALRHWRRARELLDTLPRSRETMAEGAAVRGQLMLHGFRTGLPADEVATLLAEARELAEVSGDVHALAFVVHAAGMYELYSGAPLDAAPLLEEAIAREDDGTDVGLRIWTRAAQGWVHLALGPLGEALTRIDDALALGRQHPHAGLELAAYRPYLLALSVRAWILSMLGRLAEAAQGLEQTFTLGEQFGESAPSSLSHCVYTQLCDFTGDVRAAVAHGRAAAELAEKTGNQTLRVLAFEALGVANVLDGQWREAVEALGQALTIARERRASLQLEAQLLALLARAQLGLGDTATARAAAEEAVAVARHRGTRTFEIEPHLVLGRVLIYTGARREEVQAALDAALALVDETGAKSYLPFIHLERAGLARLTGDEATRQRELHEAHRLFTEMGAPGRAAQVAEALAA